MSHRQDSGHEPAPRADKSRGMLVRLFYALRYSLCGLVAAFRHEAAFRSDLLLTAVLITVAAVLSVPLTAKALLIASVFAILIAELLNSAIESAIDYISLDTHPLAKRAKDMGSAAVFLSLLSTVIVWALVIWEYYL